MNLTPEQQEIERRRQAFLTVIAEVKTDAWKSMTRDEAVAFMRGVVEKAQGLLDVLAPAVGMTGEVEAMRERTIVLAEAMKQRAEGIVAGLVDKEPPE